MPDRTRVAPHRALLLGAFLVLASACVRTSPSRVLVDVRQVRLTGAFRLSAAPPTLGRGGVADGDLVFGSWSPQPASGTLVTPPFALPAELTLTVAGYPGAHGNVLALRADDGGELVLSIRTAPGERWRRATWRVPAAWRGRMAQLVARDSAATSWLALTMPRPGAREGVTAQAARALSLAGWLAAAVLLVGLPGAAVASVTGPWACRDAARLLAVTAAGSAAAGYLAFWAWFAGPRTGAVWTFGLPVACAGVLAWRRHAGAWPDAPVRILRRAALVTLGLALFYNAVGFAYACVPGASEQMQVRLLPHPLPPDNVLPALLAARLEAGEAPRPFLLGDWKSSDRPPLQAGLVLLVLPWRGNLDADLGYQALASWLQAWWLVTLVVLVRIGASRLSTVAVAAFAVFSGFFFVHSLFVWPKLLAAALAGLGLAQLPLWEPSGGVGARWRAADVGVAVALITLGLLSHTGIAFSLLGAVPVALVRCGLPPRRVVVLAATVALVLLLPWAAYQRDYDPPGTRLPRLHLAGIDSTSDSRSVARAVIDAYAGLSWPAIVRNKLANIETLFYRRDAGAAPIAGARDLLVAAVEGNFTSLLQALGLLNLGFVLRLIRRSGPRSSPGADAAIAIALISVAGWVLLMFVPGETRVHQASFLDLLLLFAALGVYLVESAPRPVVVTLLGLQVTGFALVAMTRPLLDAGLPEVPEGYVAPVMIGAALAALGGLALCAREWVAGNGARGGTASAPARQHVNA